MWGGKGKQVNHASVMWNRRLRRGESIVWNQRVAFNDVEKVDCTSWVCARCGPGFGVGTRCCEYLHLRLCLWPSMHVSWNCGTVNYVAGSLTNQGHLLTTTFSLMLINIICGIWDFTQLLLIPILISDYLFTTY